MFLRRDTCVSSTQALDLQVDSISWQTALRLRFQNSTWASADPFIAYIAVPPSFAERFQRVHRFMCTNALKTNQFQSNPIACRTPEQPSSNPNSPVYCPITNQCFLCRFMAKNNGSHLGPLHHDATASKITKAVLRMLWHTRTQHLQRCRHHLTGTGLSSSSALDRLGNHHALTVFQPGRRNGNGDLPGFRL